MEILDGRKISEEIQQELKGRIDLLIGNIGRNPKLNIILAGNDFASEKYVLMKEKKAQELGIDVSIHRFDENSNNEEIINTVEILNHDDNTDGIMIQLPLPFNLDEDLIVSKISVEKDVDGLTAESLGRLFRNEKCLVSATSKGIGTLIDKYDIPVEGKNVVVLGRSKVVGLPVSALMLSRNATVTICHPSTSDIESISKNADILISAVGKANFVNRNFVKEGAVVIDVGFNKDIQTGKTVGDVNFDDVKNIVSYITPVPGGVGPMTIISLLENVVDAYEKRQS
jgi:methylenetetrahydrofolate dehydrogenase (NADP+)/methenyltetrahydrofolate cyclohydrolase